MRGSSVLDITESEASLRKIKRRCSESSWNYSLGQGRGAGKMSKELPGYALHFLIMALQANYQNAEEGNDLFE